MKRIISLLISLATVVSMSIIPVKASDGEKIVATYSITAKSDFTESEVQARTEYLCRVERLR